MNKRDFGNTGWSCDANRGLTAIDAAILGRLGRKIDDWALTAADERDQRQSWDLFANANYRTMTMAQRVAERINQRRRDADKFWAVY